MVPTFKKILENKFIKQNIKYTGIGILIGICLSLVLVVVGSNNITFKRLFLNILFSLFITLSISNIFSLFEKYSEKFTRRFWQFMLLYYVCNLLGMVVGVEICYVIISFIYDFPYEFLNHLQEYKFNAVVVLIVGTMMLFYLLQKRNAETAIKAKEADIIRINQLKTQAELQALQSKINPHFLYNALNAITSLIHEDPDKAEDMTIKLSKLFRYSINSQQENFCSLKEEIEILNTYLAIEKVRFGNRIGFNINVDGSLDNLNFPRFLLQPLVENALKHGLKNTYENGLLEVNVRLQNDKVEVIVGDNGVPFPGELVAGYGLQSTFEKLQLLYPDQHDVELINEPKKHIKITLPAKI